MAQITVNATGARRVVPSVGGQPTAVLVNRRCRAPLSFSRLFGLASAGFVTMLIAVSVWLQA